MPIIIRKSVEMLSARDGHNGGASRTSVSLQGSTLREMGVREIVIERMESLDGPLIIVVSKKLPIPDKNIERISLLLFVCFVKKQ